MLLLLLQENLGNSKVCSVVKTTDFSIHFFTLVQHTSVEYSPLCVSEQNVSLFTRTQLDPVFSVYQSGSIHNKCSEMQSLMSICYAFSRFALLNFLWIYEDYMLSCISPDVML